MTLGIVAAVVVLLCLYVLAGWDDPAIRHYRERREQAAPKEGE